MTRRYCKQGSGSKLWCIKLDSCEVPGSQHRKNPQADVPNPGVVVQLTRLTLAWPGLAPTLATLHTELRVTQQTPTMVTAQTSAAGRRRRRNAQQWPKSREQPGAADKEADSEV